METQMGKGTRRLKWDGKGNSIEDRKGRHKWGNGDTKEERE